MRAVSRGGGQLSGGERGRASAHAALRHEFGGGGEHSSVVFFPVGAGARAGMGGGSGITGSAQSIGANESFLRGGRARVNQHASERGRGGVGDSSVSDACSPFVQAPSIDPDDLDDSGAAGRGRRRRSRRDGPIEPVRAPRPQSRHSRR